SLVPLFAIGMRLMTVPSSTGFGWFVSWISSVVGPRASGPDTAEAGVTPRSTTVFVALPLFRNQVRRP
ncbi:MAG: hypothetical protein NZ807_03725, partial [Dehalococcoidia bacterium]|nr:hypothetical protein [Dehalococcoidia bacterium]